MPQSCIGFHRYSCCLRPLSSNVRFHGHVSARPATTLHHRGARTSLLPLPSPALARCGRGAGRRAPQGARVVASRSLLVSMVWVAAYARQSLVVARSPFFDFASHAFRCAWLKNSRGPPLGGWYPSSARVFLWQSGPTQTVLPSSSSSTACSGNSRALRVILPQA